LKAEPPLILARAVQIQEFSLSAEIGMLWRPGGIIRSTKAEEKKEAYQNLVLNSEPHGIEREGE